MYCNRKTRKGEEEKGKEREAEAKRVVEGLSLDVGKALRAWEEGKWKRVRGRRGIWE